MGETRKTRIAADPAGSWEETEITYASGEDGDRGTKVSDAGGSTSSSRQGGKKSHSVDVRLFVKGIGKRLLTHLPDCKKKLTQGERTVCNSPRNGVMMGKGAS